MFRLHDLADLAITFGEEVVNSDDPDQPIFRVSHKYRNRGDRDRLNPLLEAFDSRQFDDFFTMLVDAWAGRKENANRMAAVVDEHFFGAMVLWQTANWCQCGAPWDREATPNFAAKIEEAGLDWPPQATLRYTLKAR